MKTLIVCVLALCNLASIYVAFENRSSEKVLSAFASLSVGALAALFLAVFVFATEPPVQAKFPVQFFIDLQSWTPARLVGIRSFTPVDMGVEAITSMRAKYPERFTDHDVETTYHALLQRLVVDWMSKVYGFSWQVAETSYDLPFGDMTMTGPAAPVAPPATILDTLR